MIQKESLDQKQMGREENVNIGTHGRVRRETVLAASSFYY